ncbi:MAG: quinone-dependent dihydroorotate dehydrogenase [Alphaproteobacteria bacterium]|nr:quinone-dependent dihydroorotate dehydrogenase [Alphaproteobacteria bacterium]
MIDYYTLLRPLIHRLPPEMAHGLAIAVLARGLVPPVKLSAHPSLASTPWGRELAHPVGLAAGFDKNAEATGALLAQGFSMVEAGTVTPKPQPGNPRPRLFRLRDDEAVINRLGFNNLGLDRFVWNLHQQPPRRGLVGANIGKNKDSQDAAADYVRGLSAVYHAADYVTVNISSPNTQGLRDLQQQEALDKLLAALMKTRRECEMLHGRRVPLLLKVAPDLTMEGCRDIADLALLHQLDGLIISNTTIARPDSLRASERGELGGLSGKPLMAPSTAILAEFYRLTQGRLLLVGVGGIASAADAYAKIRAGASLVQLYTALVYQGFGLVRSIVEGLPALLARDGFATLHDAIGADHR